MNRTLKHAYRLALLCGVIFGIDYLAPSENGTEIYLQLFYACLGYYWAVRSNKSGLTVTGISFVEDSDHPFITRTESTKDPLSDES